MATQKRVGRQWCVPHLVAERFGHRGVSLQESGHLVEHRLRGVADPLGRRYGLAVLVRSIVVLMRVRCPQHWRWRVEQMRLRLRLRRARPRRRGLLLGCVGQLGSERAVVAAAAAHPWPFSLLLPASTGCRWSRRDEASGEDLRHSGVGPRRGQQAAPRRAAPAPPHSPWPCLTVGESPVCASWLSLLRPSPCASPLRACVPPRGSEDCVVGAHRAPVQPGCRVGGRPAPAATPEPRSRKKVQ
jgi:hypothetical protein